MKKILLILLILTVGIIYADSNSSLEKEAENFLTKKFFNKKNVKEEMSLLIVFNVKKIAHETYIVTYNFSGAFKNDHYPKCIEYYNNDKCQKLIKAGDSIFWKKTSPEDFIDWRDKKYVWHRQEMGP